MYYRYYLIPFEPDEKKLTGVRIQPKYLSMFPSEAKGVIATNEGNAIDYYAVRIGFENNIFFDDIEAKNDVLRIDENTDTSKLIELGVENVSELSSQAEKERAIFVWLTGEDKELKDLF